jgi:hypothetical protein
MSLQFSNTTVTYSVAKVGDHPWLDVGRVRDEGAQGILHGRIDRGEGLVECVTRGTVIGHA